MCLAISLQLHVYLSCSVPGADISQFTGPVFDGYWGVSVFSPILFIVLIVKATLMIIKDELFRRLFVIHILAVIVSSQRVHSSLHALCPIWQCHHIIIIVSIILAYCHTIAIYSQKDTF